MWKVFGALGITVWIAYSIKGFVDLTNPPKCHEGEDCVPTAAPEGKPYELHVFLSEKATIGFGTTEEGHPWPRTGHGDVRRVGYFKTAVGAETRCGASQVVTTDPDAVPINADAELSIVRRLLHNAIGSKPQCVYAVDFEVPSAWRSNDTTLYVTSIGIDPMNKKMALFRPVGKSLTTLHAPEKKLRTHKRYLLRQRADDPEVLQAAIAAKLKEIPTVSVPRRMRIGPIELNNYADASLEKLRARGLTHWIHRQKYHPDLYLDTLVSPRDEYQSLVLTDQELPITVRMELSAVSWRKQALHRVFLQSMQNLEENFGFSQYDTDSLKLLLAGESPVILLVTFVVSGLHMLFEFLALSSNLSHFNETTKDSSRSERVSRRAVMIDTVLEVFILAWLWDEGEATIVQIMLGIKILFNLWRYFKLAAMHKARKEDSEGKLVQTPSWKDSFLLERLRLKRDTESAEQFEQSCLHGLAKVMIPIAVGVAAYQLVWVPQKGWISWAIKSCAMSSYVGGFIAMTPQLYKNFYFRSVEHLPWTTLTYQFLNTIIDDLFSFLIRMPPAHRASVFRDDIIFVIYWAQKRHYKGMIKGSEGVDKGGKGIETELKGMGDNKGVRRRAIEAVRTREE